MKTTCFIVLAAGVLLVGCGDNSAKTGAATNSTTSGNPLDAPADYLGAMNKAKQAAVKTVDLGALRQAIQMFNVDNSRNPKDLKELVELKYLPQIPAAPYGMKIDYDAATGTVKIVKQ